MIGINLHLLNWNSIWLIRNWIGKDYSWGAREGKDSMGEYTHYVMLESHKEWRIRDWDETLTFFFFLSVERI